MAPSEQQQTADPAELARARALGQKLGLDLDELSALLLLDSVRGFGPQKFRELFEAGVSAGEVIENPALLPSPGKRGDQLRAALDELSQKDRDLACSRAARQLVRAQENDSRILSLASPEYPRNVLESNNPVPVLYARGSSEGLQTDRLVACVGSRGIRPPYDARLRSFSRFATEQGFGVVSGFATGADRIGHEAAFEAGGLTVLVMPCGLDRPFPPENRALWHELLAYPHATIVSEFAFGTSASSLTLRKRNKLIVAFARGVLVAQSSVSGGAMNAWRFALEQKKPVATFEQDGAADTRGNAEMADPPPPPPPENGKKARPKRPVPPATAFPAAADDNAGWDRWLHGLSSSI